MVDHVVLNGIIILICEGLMMYAQLLRKWIYDQSEMDVWVERHRNALHWSVSVSIKGAVI
jgi:hypothetical protein